MRTIAIVMLAMLSGYQTALATEPDTSTNPVAPCMTDLADRSEFDIIRDKLVLISTTDPTFEMLTDTAKPNADEKKAIAAWVNGTQECFNIAREWIKQQNAPPAYLSDLTTILEAGHSSLLNLTADLYNGKLTYGEYNKARATQHTQTQQQIADVTRHYQEQQAAAQEQDRRAKWNAFSKMWERQADFYHEQLRDMKEHAPITTNCYVLGNAMHCTTQ